MISNVNCIFCNRVEESTFHILVHCPFVLDFWNFLHIFWFHYSTYQFVKLMDFLEVRLYFFGSNYALGYVYVGLLLVNLAWKKWKSFNVIFKSQLFLFNSILLFVQFCTYRLALPLKRKVSTQSFVNNVQAAALNSLCVAADHPLPLSKNWSSSWSELSLLILLSCKLTLVDGGTWKLLLLLHLSSSARIWWFQSVADCSVGSLLIFGLFV